MPGKVDHQRIQRRITDALFVEAMLLADEARGYFEADGRTERDELDPLLRVGFSCESLKVTTRLMHVIAWLLTQRAIGAGELRAHDGLDPSRRLGNAPTFDADLVRALPQRARALVSASSELHRRVGLLDEAQVKLPGVSPVASMHARLANAF